MLEPACRVKVGGGPPLPSASFIRPYERGRDGVRKAWRVDRNDHGPVKVSTRPTPIPPIMESSSTKAYRQSENKTIHSNFEGVKIGLIE